MDFFKKEWKAIALILCLLLVAVYLVKVNSRLIAVEHQNAKIISTFGSIESVTISSDATVNDMARKVDKVESNVSYLVNKARRRR